MNKPQQPNDAYLADLDWALNRFVDLVKAENSALEHQNSQRLWELTPKKVEAGKVLDDLTRDFRSRLGAATDEEIDAFSDLVHRAASLRPLLERNMALLNAAKVTTATRIEAGVAAWRRSQNEMSIGYGDDGCSSHADQPASINPSRLI